ncbi:MAG: DUF6092 family protein [Acidimicrobiales bacterium]
MTPRDPAAFRLATFLVTAARDVVDEPAIYGPFRMIDAVDRLMAGTFDDEFLTTIKPELEREKQKVMSDRDGFVAWLDELSARFAAEAKRRNVEGTGMPAPER